MGRKHAFPLEGLSSCVNSSQWDQNEDVLPMLRQFAMKSSVAELDMSAEHADLAAKFLLGIQERRRSQRARVVETAKALARSQAWERVLQQFPNLLQASPPPVAAHAPELSSAPLLNELSPAISSQLHIEESAPGSSDQPPAAPPQEDFAPAAPCAPLPWEDALAAQTLVQTGPLPAGLENFPNPFDDTLPAPADRANQSTMRTVQTLNPFDDTLSALADHPNQSTIRTVQTRSPFDTLSENTLHTQRAPLPPSDTPIWEQSLGPHAVDQARQKTEDLHHAPKPFSGSPPSERSLELQDVDQESKTTDKMQQAVDKTTLLPAGPLDPSAVDLIPVSVVDQMRVAVKAVLAIDNFESQAVLAFVTLKHATLHASQLPADEMHNILQTEAEHAHAVLAFLVDLVSSSPIRNNQVCEVLRILLACQAWQGATRSSPSLTDRMNSNTPVEVRELLEQYSKTNGHMGSRFARAASKATGQMGSRFANVAKRKALWMLACGQKSGQGVNSPSNRAGVGSVGGA